MCIPGDLNTHNIHSTLSFIICTVSRTVSIFELFLPIIKAVVVDIRIIKKNPKDIKHCTHGTFNVTMNTLYLEALYVLLVNLSILFFLTFWTTE